MIRFLETPLFYSLAVSLGSFLFGYHLGIFSGVSLFVKDHFSLSIFEQQCFASMILIGAILGSIIGGKLVDRLSSRKVLFVGGCIALFATYWTAVSPTCAHLFYGRLVLGISLGLFGVSVVSYIVAIAPSASRGAYVSIHQLAIVLGLLVANSVSYFYASMGNWRAMLFFPIWPALLLLLLLFMIPEVVPEAGKEKKNFSAFFKPPFNRPFWIAIALGAIQQLTGINLLIYYAPQIFQQAGYHSVESAIFVTLFLGIINLISTVIAFFLIDWWGRKPLLLLSLATMGLSFLVLALCLSKTLIAPKEVPAISTLLAVGAFAIGMGPVYWLLVSEIFPIQLRGQALGISNLVTWIMNIGVVSTFLSFLSTFGAGGTFGLYALILALSFLYVWKQIPETKGKTMNEIQALWR